MLESGKDSESLRILASLSTPFDYWEVQRYLESAFYELGVQQTSEAASLSIFVADQLRCMLRGDATEADTLWKLQQLCIEYDHRRSLNPFYRLYFAFHDLSAGRQTFYWPDADAENIHQIIRTAASQYLAESENVAEPGAAGDAR